MALSNWIGWIRSGRNNHPKLDPNQPAPTEESGGNGDLPATWPPPASHRPARTVTDILFQIKELEEKLATLTAELGATYAELANLRPPPPPLDPPSVQRSMDPGDSKLASTESEGKTRASTDLRAHAVRMQRSNQGVYVPQAQATHSAGHASRAHARSSSSDPCPPWLSPEQWLLWQTLFPQSPTPTPEGWQPGAPEGSHRGNPQESPLESSLPTRGSEPATPAPTPTPDSPGSHRDTGGSHSGWDSGSSWGSHSSPSPSPSSSSWSSSSDSGGWSSSDSGSSGGSFD